MGHSLINQKTILALVLAMLLAFEAINAALPLQSQTEAILADKRSSNRASMTCNKYPRICRTKGSPGPDCCDKRCVNTNSDRSNCGKCGKKCKYSEICCKGKCVNPMSNTKHCGGCNNKCDRGNKCVYGMCSYA